MTHRRTYDPENRREVFDILRSQILAARLKVTLDEKQSRETSPMVMRLSKMELPPIVQSHYCVDDVQAAGVAQNAADVRSGQRRKEPADEIKNDLGLDD